MSSGILEQDALDGPGLKSLVCLVKYKSRTHQMLLYDSRGQYVQLNKKVGRTRCSRTKKVSMSMNMNMNMRVGRTRCFRTQEVSISRSLYVQDALDALGLERLVFLDHYMCGTHQMIKDLRGQYVQLNICIGRTRCSVTREVSISRSLYVQDALDSLGLKRLVFLVEHMCRTQQMLQD